MWNEMKISLHRSRLKKSLAALTIVASVFGVSGSALAAVVSFDQTTESKAVGNDLVIADWNKIIQSLDGISFDDSGDNDNWGFGTAAVGTHTIATGGGVSVGGALDITGLTTLNGGLTIETGDTLTYGGQAMTLFSTGVANNDALVTQGYVDDGIAALDPAIFGVTGGVTSNENGTYASDSFVFGSPSMDNDADPDHHSRMFFDKGNAAFRMGYVDGTQWDTRGYNSVGMGYNNIASGTTSFAAGYATQATGYSGFAFGFETIASGNYSSAIGLNVTSHDTAEAVFGRYNVIGTGNQTTWDPADSLFVIGNGTADGARSNALTILKNGTTTINAPADGALLTQQPTGGTALAIATTQYVDDAAATTEQVATGAVTCAAAGDVGNIGYVAATGGQPGYFEGCIETASAGVYAVVRLSIFEQ